MVKCKPLENIMKSLPFVTIEKTYETVTGCGLDYRDKELQDKLLKDTGGEFGAVFSSKGSVSIEENKIKADIPINLYAKKKYHMQKKIGEIVPQSCLIKAIHIHDSLIPAVHTHIECDISSRVDLSNIIKEANKISRDIAGLET